MVDPEGSAIFFKPGCSGNLWLKQGEKEMTNLNKEINDRLIILANRIDFICEKRLTESATITEMYSIRKGIIALGDELPDIRDEVNEKEKGEKR